MKTLLLLLLALATTLIAVPCLGTSGVPSLTLSTAEIADGTGEILTLMVVPDGSGPGFAAAADAAGNQADATIELVLRDPQGMPIVLFPLEDLWLESGDPASHLAGCRGFGSHPAYLVPDAHTDIDGRTRWTLPPAAGGYTAGPTQVIVNGSALQGTPGLPLSFNSPDITGDGKVDLSDVVPFAVDFYGDYHLRSDLQHDGVINLSDVAKMAEHMGAVCP